MSPPPPLPRLVPLFDAHCHLQDERLSGWERVVESGAEQCEGGDEQRNRFRRLDAVVAAARSSGVRGVACCACRESDWPVVASLADRYPGFVRPSFGLHPWFLNERREGWERRLECLLRDRPGAGVGESGLDKAKTSEGRSLPPLEVQVEALVSHARIARELRRPLTVHCVRAAGTLYDALSPLAPFSKRQGSSLSSSLDNTSLVVHGWNGAAEEAKRMARLGNGVFFSLGSRSVLRPKKSRTAKKKNDDDGGGTSDNDAFLSHIPLDRLLLETDSPDGYSPLFGPGIEAVVAPRATATTEPSPSLLNQPATLLALLPRVAEALGASEEEVARTSYENARGVFCVGGEGDEGDG